MGVTVSLSDSAFHVIPGQETVCVVHVRNTGSVVDQVTVDLVGPASTWSVIEPPVLNLFPGDTGEVRIHFRPPRSPRALAGAVPFGVRAVSREDPRGSAVEEGVVEVAPFTELRAELLPRTSRGRRKGKHRLEVANLGNHPIGAEVVPLDPDEKLRFKISRPAFTAEPGVATTVDLVAIPRENFFRGPNQTKPFQVQIVPERGEMIAADGALEHKATLPGWVVPVAAAIVALALIAATLWFTVLRGAVQSAAREAAQKEVEPAKAAAVAAQKDAGDAKQAANDAKTAAGGAGASKPPTTPPGATGPNGVGTDQTGAPLDRNIDFRILADAPVRPANDNGFNTFTSTVQGKRALDVTDIQLQNPAGDSGFIEIRRGPNNVVLRFGLDNFRDYDSHWVSPLRFTKDETLTFAVQCRNPGTKRCTPAITVSGRTTAAP